MGWVLAPFKAGALVSFGSYVHKRGLLQRAKNGVKVKKQALLPKKGNRIPMSVRRAYFLSK